MCSAQAPRKAVPSMSQEALLERYLSQLDKRCEGRRAVHIHVSRLHPRYRKPHHLRIAADTFETLVKQFSGQIFTLSSGDLVFVCKDAEAAQIDEAVMRVRQLFSDDPLATADMDNMQERFCSWYDLEQDYTDLRQAAQEMLIEYKKQQADGGPKGSRSVALRPLTPRLLDGFEGALAQADLTNLMRRQPICALSAETEPKPILHELFISIGDLQKSLAPKIDLFADPWLFQRLTRTLDRRMLSMVSRNDDSTISTYFSLNLNVATLLSPEFLKFDASLQQGARGTVVLELQMIDVFSDMGAYAFARDFVQDRGYRVCMDGLTHLNAPFIERDRLGLDLVKIRWTPDLLDDPIDARREYMKEAIGRIGASRIILCHCDSDDAISYGQGLGVAVFQGRHVDALRATAQPKGAMTISEARTKAEAG